MSARQGVILGLLAAILTLPWAVVQFSMSINGDVAWLTQAAQRLLAGAEMSQSYFDTNPPMSIIVYTLPALLVEAGVAPWQAIFFYTALLLTGAAMLDIMVMRRWAGMSPSKLGGIMAAHMLIVTLAAQHEFGQKDHLIAVAVMPLLLAQFSRLRDYNVGRGLFGATVLLAVPFILLKPHYGLLPVLMMAARGVRARDVRQVIGFDFIALAAGTVTYALAVILFFPDFLAVILPASIEAYVSVYEEETFAAAAGLFLLAGCLGVCAWFIADREARAQAMFFITMALAATVAVLVQMKGFSAHMLPALGLLAPGLVAVLAGYRPGWFAKAQTARAALVMAVICLAGYQIWPPNTRYPTHDDYRRSEIAQMIIADGDGAFFIQANTTNIVAPLSVYTGAAQASRFPAQWFMPLETKEAGYWAAMTAADWVRYRPGLVFLLAEAPPGWDISAMFAADPDFAAVWSDYRLTGQVTIDPVLFYAGTRFAKKKPVIYNVYSRSD